MYFNLKLIKFRPFTQNKKCLVKLSKMTRHFIQNTAVF